MLEERGLLMRQGTIVDATIIAAPPSTKNKEKSRDPEMHQTKKGNQWHFGMGSHTFFSYNNTNAFAAGGPTERKRWANLRSGYGRHRGPRQDRLVASGGVVIDET